MQRPACVRAGVRCSVVPTRCIATSRRASKPATSAELKESKLRARPTKESIPAMGKGFERRQKLRDAQPDDYRQALDELGEERIDEEKEDREWREGLRDFNPTFKGLKFNRKTVPVSSDSEADSWMRNFMKLDVSDKPIPDEAFAAREASAKRPPGGAVLTEKDIEKYAPTPEERGAAETRREKAPMGDLGPAGKLLRMNAEIEDFEGKSYWNNIQIPAEYVKYFEQPDNPRSMPQRIQRYMNKMKRIEEWQKQNPREKRQSSWRADSQDAPYTRRQMAVTDKLQEILERVLTEYMGTEWPVALRKADFKIVECIVSKDMRRLQVIWDCKPGRRDEIQDYFTRDLSILRQEITRRAEMKWSPELQFIHFDESEVAEVEAEEARQAEVIQMLEEELQKLPEGDREEADGIPADTRRMRKNALKGVASSRS